MNDSDQVKTVKRASLIVRGIGSLGLQSVLSAVLGFILLGSLLRFLPSIDYGAYAAVQVSVSIVGILGGFRLSLGVVRFLAANSSDAKGPGWGAAKAALLLHILLASAVSLTFGALAPLLSDYFMKTTEYSWVFYLSALYLFVLTMSNPFQRMLQGMRRYSLLAKILLGSRSVSVAIAVVGVVFYRSLALAIVALIVYGSLITISALPTVLGPLRKATSKGHYMEVIRYAFPLGLAGLVVTIAGSADLVIVGGYLDPSSFAIYSAAVVISSVLSLLFVTPLVTTLFAETSFSSGNDHQVKLGTSLAIRFTMATILPSSFFAAAMAFQLFILFSGGGEYAQGVPYLEVITLFYVLTALQTVVINILQGIGKTRQVLITGSAAALVEAVLAAALVPHLSLSGAAYSRVASFVVGGVSALYFIRGYLPGKESLRFVVKALVASIIPALVALLLSAFVSDRVLTLLPYSVLGITVFFLCARLLRLLSEQDKAYLRHLLPAGLWWVVNLL